MRTARAGDLGIEHLPGELPGLLQYFRAVFCVGVVAKVGALVHEAPTLPVHHDAERVAIAAERGARVELAESAELASVFAEFPLALLVKVRQ